MFYRELASIANHVSDGEIAVTDILQMFSMRELANLKFVSAFFFQVEQDGKLHLHSFYGLTPEEIGLAELPISIDEDYPFTRCIRENRLIWSGTTRSSKLKLPQRYKSVLAWPVLGEFKVLGSFLTITESPYREDEDLIECLEALASIVSGALTRRVLNLPNQSKFEEISNNLFFSPQSLSQRQELILKLISEGRTNNDIADILGYSESLIRQETIKIYAILGCSGRSEASEIYRRRLLTEPILENKTGAGLTPHPIPG